MSALLPIGAATPGFHTVVTNSTLTHDSVVLPGTYVETLTASRTRTLTSTRSSSSSNWGNESRGTWSPYRYSTSPAAFLVQQYSIAATQTYPGYPGSANTSRTFEFFAADSATGGWKLTQQNPPQKVDPSRHLGATWQITASRGANQDSYTDYTVVGNTRTRIQTRTFIVGYSYKMKAGSLVK